MFEIFKFILLFIVGIIIASGVFFTSVFNNNNISKDDTVNNYNNFLQDIAPNGLTKDSKLKGKREFGIDKYVGIYNANYVDDTKEETIFGGTTLNRKEGNSVKLKIKKKKKKGNIEIISNEGTTSVILINDTGEIEKMVNVKEKSYYLKIKVINFTGNVEIISE